MVAAASASSQNSELTAPAFVTDDNYATQWSAASKEKGAWLQLDLGSVKDITRQIIRPEYASKATRFSVEASEDGKESVHDVVWRELADANVASRIYLIYNSANTTPIRERVVSRFEPLALK